MTKHPDHHLPLRTPDHPDINEALIADLVNAFYGKVRADARLGPIFEENISASWDEHLLRMRSFWSAVMMKTGEYKGRPVPAHMPFRKYISPPDFAIWLDLFRQTAKETCTPDIAECFIRRAEAIAESLQRNVLFMDRVLPSDAFTHGVLTEKPERFEGT